MKSKISKIAPFVAVAFALVPMLAFAQNTGNFTGAFFFNLLDFVRRVMAALFPIVSGALILLFGYDLIMYFVKRNQGDGKASDDFKTKMWYAFIALFLWFTIFGLVQVLAGAFNIGVGDDVQRQQNPGVQF